MNPADVVIIRKLRNAETHLALGDLEVLTGKTGGFLRERIAALVEAGFAIEDVPGRGLRLLASPDRLMADDLFARLAPQTWWREIVVYRETDSTNERAAQLGRSGATGGIAVFAERQTAGRGRFGRCWASASDKGLWFSMLLRPELPVAHWPRLTTWAAVSMARTIETALGLDLSIKWPNDLTLDDRKVAGILTEAGTASSGEAFAVLGIGLNVNHEAADFPEELAGRASSLRLAKGAKIFRPELAAALLAGFAETRGVLASRFDEIVAEAAKRSSVLGKRIAIRRGEETLEGIAAGLDSEGRLLLRADSGELHTLAAGEVTLARR